MSVVVVGYVMYRKRRGGMGCGGDYVTLDSCMNEEICAYCVRPAGLGGVVLVRRFGGAVQQGTERCAGGHGDSWGKGLSDRGGPGGCSSNEDVSSRATLESLCSATRYSASSAVCSFETSLLGLNP